MTDLHIKKGAALGVLFPVLLAIFLFLILKYKISGVVPIFLLWMLVITGGIISTYIGNASKISTSLIVGGFVGFFSGILTESIVLLALSSGSTPQNGDYIFVFYQLLIIVVIPGTLVSSMLGAIGYFLR